MSAKWNKPSVYFYFYSQLQTITFVHIKNSINILKIKKNNKICIKQENYVLFSKDIQTIYV